MQIPGVPFGLKGVANAGDKLTLARTHLLDFALWHPKCHLNVL